MTFGNKFSIVKASKSSFRHLINNFESLKRCVRKYENVDDFDGLDLGYQDFEVHVNLSFVGIFTDLFEIWLLCALEFAAEHCRLRQPEVPKWRFWEPQEA